MGFNLQLQILFFGLVLAALISSTRAGPVPTLSSKSLWRLKLVLSDATSGAKVEAVARVRFIEEPGYEPPSGKLFVENDLAGILRVNEKGYACNWNLGEDKNDRKDGLWIWGLFEDPKFPFLYFNLNIFDSVVLPSGEEQKLPFEVPGDTLYCRFGHVFSKTDGVKLDQGLVSFKLAEFAQADPLGIGGSINVGDEVIAGTITLLPVNDDVERLRGGEEYKASA